LIRDMRDFERPGKVAPLEVPMLTVKEKLLITVHQSYLYDNYTVIPY